MDKSISLVLVHERRDYRKVAQKNWGLSDDQMVGMHVHHLPPVSEGGRNIPEHLYVCSPSMHSNGWHNGEYFIEQATKAGQKYGHRGGAVGGKCPWWTKDGIDVRSWDSPGEGWSPGRYHARRLGLLPYWNNGSENRRSNDCPGYGWKKGSINVWWTNGIENKKQIECPGAGWSKGRSNILANNQKWMCTVTGKVSTAGPLSIYQKSLGICTLNRVKVQ